MNTNERGFTLAELMLAVLLLTVGVLGMASVAATTTARHSRIVSRMELVSIGESKLEQLRAIATGKLADTVQLKVGGSLSTDETNYYDAVQSPRGRWYDRRWAVIAGPAGTRQITLRVRPRNRTTRDLAQLDFTTLILII